MRNAHRNRNHVLTGAAISNAVPRYFEITYARRDGSCGWTNVYPESGLAFMRNLMATTEREDWHITHERELTRAEIDLLGSAGELPTEGLRTTESCGVIVARIKRHRARLALKAVA